MPLARYHYLIIADSDVRVAPDYLAKVVAPSRIPRRPGERIKTDRRDALKLAGLARAGELVSVTIPDERDEAIRDLSRARVDAVRARLKARQQLKALMLRHGRRYSGKTSWCGPRALPRRGVLRSPGPGHCLHRVPPGGR